MVLQYSNSVMSYAGCMYQCLLILKQFSLSYNKVIIHSFRGPVYFETQCRISPSLVMFYCENTDSIVKLKCNLLLYPHRTVIMCRH